MSRDGYRSRLSCSRVVSLSTCLLTLLISAAASATTGGRGGTLAGPLADVARHAKAGDEAVTVEVLFKTPQAAGALDLSRLGGWVQCRRDERVQALVPPTSLKALAKLPGVAQVAPPAQMIPCQGFGPVVSEAVQFTNARSLQEAGYRGAGARIAIVDLGFADLDDTEVPVNVADPTAVLSFRTDQSTTASNHGTAMAETVADMAPGASLTLIAVDTPMSVQNAIDYIVAQGFDIAVMGLVVVDGPFDGTHPLTRSVNMAANAGVLWVQAAGNMATRHWAGQFTDRDNDAILEFTEGTEDLNLTLQAGEFHAYLSWFETAGPLTGQDYDLVLRDAQGNRVAQSAYGQNGDDPPREHLSCTIRTTGTYRLQIVRIGGQAKADKFQLFIPDYDLPTTLQVKTSSLAIPAEAPKAFTVGATRGTTVDATAYGYAATPIDVIEPFSSQGPTLTGIRKPNLVAPDGCRTSLADPGDAPLRGGWEYVAPNAFGTSFAAAHVAGAAALLKSENSSRTASELAQALVNLATAVPPPLPPTIPLPNNIYGDGRLNLRTGTDVTKPTLRITYPRNGDTITTTQPVITALLIDQGGSGIAPSTIVLTLDGEKLTGFSFDPESGVLTYRVAPPAHAPLSLTSHRLTLDAKDAAGNAGDQATSSFRVSPPRISAGLHMISVPYAQLQDLRPSTLFAVPPEQVVLVRWLPTDTTPTNKYHWFGGVHGEDQYASLEPLDTKEWPFVVTDPPAGLGYFLNLGQDATLNPTGITLSGLPKYEIKLSYGYTYPRGWNMIGCPFPDPVTWGGVQFVTNGVRQDLKEAIASGVTEGVLFELKRAAGQPYYDFPSDPLAGTLQPWKGYWVHVLKDTTLVTYNSLMTTSAVTEQRRERSTPTADRWTLRFGATVAGGCDPANYIAVDPQASDGYDPGLDVPEPPALNTPVRVTMSRPEWGERGGDYAKDVRGATGLGQEWDVCVICAQANVDVTVSWPDLNATVPKDVNLVLQDVASGREVFMRTAAGYTYRSGSDGETRRFKIVARPARGGTLLLTGVTAAQAQDGSVQVSYVVTQAAEVTAEVLNIAGRSIRRLGAQTAAGGAVVTQTWNRRNEQGARVPAGRYLVRVTARTESGQACSAVRAFQLGP